MRTKPRKAITALVFTAGLTAAGTTPALAYAPVDIVHTEHVKAGPYDVTVGFSTWPIRPCGRWTSHSCHRRDRGQDRAVAHGLAAAPVTQ